MLSKHERIEAAYHSDVAEARKVYNASEVPPFYEAITPEWLSAILCRDTPGSAVTAFWMDAVDDGTCNRRRLFIDYNAVGRDAGLPRTVFCKAAQGLANRLLLSASATFSEVTFYRRFRPILTLDAPVAFHADYNKDSWAAIVLLRDMAGEAEFCSERTRLTRASVESQLNLLASLHGPFYDDPRLKTEFASLLPFHWRLNNMDRQHGIGVCCEEGLEAAEHLVPARLFQQRGRVWETTLAAVNWQAGQVETLTHSDVHLKNWYRRPDGQMGLSDWQAFGRGHWARDVAYTLGTALPVEARRAQEQDLLHYYLDRLAAHGGPTLDYAEAFRHYRAQVLGALAYWTLTYRPSGSMPDMQPVETTEVFVHRLATAADDLESLSAVDA
ncbi:hypothetical protein [Sphingosinicella sp. LY1275]|uniref:hypothetical protein n=1 Tax=Sphingosinicella sp. LY1275 TaxID=3095379 RepID=UPI002ADEE881|nr:hypothetical protein [Sphingosinicella sp. LY1275]MEA1015263.1 hypothetical protein [Sphingosinicella sp. LY1275]